MVTLAAASKRHVVVYITIVNGPYDIRSLYVGFDVIAK